VLHHETRRGFFSAVKMAKEKNSFLLYCDIIHTVEKLDDVQAGKLFKHLLKYVNDQNPTPENALVEIAFEPIKQSLKRDLIKYETIRERNSENAKKRWNATASDRIPKVPKDTKNADSDSVSDSVISKDIYTKQKFSFLSALIENGFDEKLSREWMQVRKQKKAVNTETAFKKFISQVELHGGDKNYILRNCVERSWAGFESAWLAKPVINAAYGLTNDWDG
jgi:hypothetical protein